VRRAAVRPAQAPRSCGRREVPRTQGRVQFAFAKAGCPAGYGGYSDTSGAIGQPERQGGPQLADTDVAGHDTDVLTR